MGESWTRRVRHWTQPTGCCDNLKAQSVTGWRRGVAQVEGVAEAWNALGRQLAASRRAAGLSQQRLASLTDYSRSTIANAETGRQRAPREFWQRCDAALGTGNALSRGYQEVAAAQRRRHIGAAAAAQQARAVMGDHIGAGAGGLREARPDGVADGSPGVDQIESIRQRLTRAVSQDVVTAASPDAWEQTVLHHGQATRGRPPGELVIELGADMAGLEMAIKWCRSASSMRRLVRVAAQMSGLMCLQFVKLDERAAFRRWALTARTAATEAGDPGTASWVLAQEAYGRYYSGDLAGAVNVARHAQGLMRRTPCVGTALAAALEARAHAARGDTRETRGALGRAETILTALDANSVTASAFGYSESQYRFHEGNAYTRLRDTRAALKAQERALEVCSPGDYTDWALIRLDRASCLAHDGDAPDAVAYATETLNRLSGEQSQGIIALRGRELVRALPVRYQAVPAVREFEELLMAAAGPSKEMPCR